ncbi:MAG: DNA polymerase III subunit gamma/tau [Trueperaceae bacterium]
MEAIYQRARPSTFGEVVGQEHVKEVLAAALRRGRTGHAYLFSGPRGVGKTTTARLLAMALNCEASDLATRPCGRCGSCSQVRTGSHPDVTELDAASHNSVDDVRELRERVRLASLGGGVRVWILDEAHMLSGAAANALLKTLEEPPPGLVFVLATTEPERLPPTVLSRCQHFRFRRLSVNEIAGKLAGLCEAADVEAEAEALQLVARAADGAMRDAESLLERLWADGGPIRRQAAEEALGLPPRERLEALATALAGDDLGPLLQGATDLYRDGFSPRTVAEQLARLLRDAVVHEVTGDDGFRVPLDHRSLLTTLHQFDDDLDRFVRQDDLYALEATLIKASNAAHDRIPRDRAPQADAAFDAEPAPAAPSATAAEAEKPSRSGRARAAPSDAPATDARGPLPDFDPVARDRSPAGDPDRATSEHGSPAAHAARAAVRGAAPNDAPPDEPAEAPDEVSDEVSDEAAAPQAPPGERRSLSWHQVKSRAGAQLKAFLQPADDALEGDTLVLRYGERHRFHFQQLKARLDDLHALVREVGGDGWALRVEGPEETLRKKA